jgi:hypothetical protein
MEALVAKEISNRNVLTIEGVQTVGDLGLCIVSPWMEHGSMRTYLRNDEIDHVDLVSPNPSAMPHI